MQKETSLQDLLSIVVGCMSEILSETCTGCNKVMESASCCICHTRHNGRICHSHDRNTSLVSGRRRCRHHHHRCCCLLLQHCTDATRSGPAIFIVDSCTENLNCYEEKHTLMIFFFSFVYILLFL